MNDLYNRHCVSSQDKFNAEVIDTFCFHWPDMHCYVLVRVLEKTIAILPIHSRLAFLYFHDAPLPTHPSPKELRKALLPSLHSSKRIQDMFKSWKHTLILDEPKEAPETPPSTPKTKMNVTLSDVLSFEQDLSTGWLHAPCIVNDDINIYDNTVILNTKHTSVKLICRCFSDKMAFMNLVKLKFERNLDMENKSDDSDRESLHNNSTKTSTFIIDQLQHKTIYQVDSIQNLTEQIKLSKKDISTYTQQLLELDKSLEAIEDSTSIIQFHALESILHYVNQQLTESLSILNSYRVRISKLHEKVSLHNLFLSDTRKRFEMIRTRVRNHAWYPWFYTSMAGLILVFSMILSFFLYKNVKK